MIHKSLLSKKDKWEIDDNLNAEKFKLCCHSHCLVAFGSLLKDIMF